MYFALVEAIDQDGVADLGVRLTLAEDIGEANEAELFKLAPETGFLWGGDAV